MPALPYLLSAVLLVLMFDGFYRDPPVLVALHIVYLYFAVALGIFLANMAWAFRAHRDPTTRALIKAVLPGAALAAMVQFVIFINNALSGRNLPLQFGLLTPIPYYLSIAYAIAKHDLFDIDRIVRQSFVYAVLSVVVVSVYAATLMVPRGGSRVSGDSRKRCSAWSASSSWRSDSTRCAAPCSGASIGHSIRTRLDYQATISRLSEVMTTLLDLREVVAQVTQVVTEAMHLESTSLYLREPSGGGLPVVAARRRERAAANARASTGTRRPGLRAGSAGVCRRAHRRAADRSAAARGGAGVSRGGRHADRRAADVPPRHRRAAGTWVRSARANRSPPATSACCARWPTKPRSPSRTRVPTRLSRRSRASWMPRCASAPTSCGFATRS